MVVVGGIAPKQWPPTASEIEVMATEFGVAPTTLAAHISDVFYLDEENQAKTLTSIQKIADIVAHIVNERNILMGKVRNQDVGIRI